MTIQDSKQPLVLFLLTGLVLGLPQQVLSQSITSAPDGTGTVINHNGDTYQINGGTRAGLNLFHSFQDFGLEPSEVANFLSDDSIDNILGRVTGGDPSIVQGLLQVSGGNSNLFLTNPAGWIFTDDAGVDVSGSFGVTTANRIGFSNGFFNSAGDNDYAALSGNPTSLIFDSTQPGAIFNGANLEIDNGSLWMVGGSVISTGSLTAPNGTITLAAVPGESQVQLSHDSMVLSLLLDAVPSDTLPTDAANGIRPVDLPSYLNSTDSLGNASELEVDADGNLWLVGSQMRIEEGDVIIDDRLTAQTINLLAAEQVLSTEPNLVTGDVTVVRYSGASDPLTFTAIDTTVEDYQTFLFGGDRGTISFTVNPDENGITKIGDRLSNLEGTGTQADAIQIISEGDVGNFWLGNTFISEDTIEQYEAEFAGWQPHLTTTADLLIYACLTAFGEVGDRLLQYLADTTGTDVAASTDLTGSTALGGDWILEKSVGAIGTSPQFTTGTLANYLGKLAIFTVTDGADTGAGSLRQAISDANGAAGADEIRFSNVPLVDLTSGELTITDELTLTGGNSNVTVQRNAGAGDFRIFNVTGGVTTTFDNLTITNGETTGNGGGINSNGEVNLTNTTVSGNTSSDRGGGLYNTTHAVNIIDSTISGNTSSDNGGGIYNRSGNITVTDSVISGNSSNRYGGGIHTRGQIGVTNSTISGNFSRRNGGGLYSRSGNITVTDSTVSDNQSNRHGGGVWARNRNITITNSTISGNSSRLSAAGTYSSTLIVTDSLVSGNTSGDLGGGLYTTGSATITNSTISGNSSSNKGGGIYFRKNLDITNSTLSGNSSNRGGGIYSRGGGTVNITNSTISGNSSTNRGGGIFARGSGGGTINIRNSTIAHNTADNNGGGIFRNGGGFDITNTIIANNTAANSGNDLSGTFTSIQDSLIGDPIGATITTDLNNLKNVDPQLLPLGDYGGDTQTHAFYLGSPVHNAGNDALAAALVTDQRGANRFNGTVDIGAFESQGYSLTTVTGHGQVALVNKTFDTALSAQITENFVHTAIPVENVPIIFNANHGNTGASGSPGGSVLTDADGLATAANMFTANAIAGDFTVTASSPNLSSAIFNLTNLPIPESPNSPESPSEPNVPDVQNIWPDPVERTEEITDNFIGADCQTIPAVEVTDEAEKLDEQLDEEIKKDQDDALGKLEQDCSLSLR
ncbi:filamentous hemagglutinin family outer membrane protein [[Leptolyngbya] sp. PCC 7376]|uniref:DUF4347 domain-containing protein n=1 Tax=[Leptolyngbya] sp. PCC 7376 TaxID=111781 RepID=UPI00029EF102|nr:DUF4347 domain-containing protein [[Leptolyngbya] sp. PCC 7376]AFY37648.1 filamentous hemagglutinin family outer membrane protein [[Leptolyngbya] sp. PCC 7376]